MNPNQRGSERTSCKSAGLLRRIPSHLVMNGRACRSEVVVTFILPTPARRKTLFYPTEGLEKVHVWRLTCCSRGTWCHRAANHRNATLNNNRPQTQPPAESLCREKRRQTPLDVTTTRQDDVAKLKQNLVEWCIRAQKGQLRKRSSTSQPVKH